MLVRRAKQLTSRGFVGVVQGGDADKRLQLGDRVYCMSSSVEEHAREHRSAGADRRCASQDVHVLPAALSDEQAALIGEMAVAVCIAQVAVHCGSIQCVAVNATARDGHAVACLLHCLETTAHVAREDICVRYCEDDTTEGPNITTWLQTHDIDLCVDLCCTDASLDWAVHTIQPLGVICLVPSDDNASDIHAIDANALVVNELDIRVIFRDDWTKHIDVAIAALLVHKIASQLHVDE